MTELTSEEIKKTDNMKSKIGNVEPLKIEAGTSEALGEDQLSASQSEENEKKFHLESRKTEKLCQLCQHDPTNPGHH